MLTRLRDLSPHRKPLHIYSLAAPARSRDAPIIGKNFLENEEKLMKNQENLLNFYGGLIKIYEQLIEIYP